jgi:hypothetical protein
MNLNSLPGGTTPELLAEVASRHPSDADLRVLQAAVAVMSRALNDLVGACLDADGKPKAPTKKDLMRARSMLPPRFAHALGKEQHQ